MKVRFWGVRGSSPTPLTSRDVKEKMITLIHRMKPEDLQTKERKEHFLNSLPEHIFGTTGGNTSCVEIRLIDNTLLIFDCGTGLRELYKSIQRKAEEDSIEHYHIFLSHFHYDHLLGLPFFPPLYIKGKKVTFYSPYSSMEKIIFNYFRKPYHPVGFNSFQADVQFYVLGKETLSLGTAEIDWIKRSHPDGTIAYRIHEGSKKMVYSTDTELDERNFRMTRKNKAFFLNLDLIILDSQYTLIEALEKTSWGHSSFSLAIEFANVFKIKKLFLFHHEPSNSDRDVEKIESMARQYQSHVKDKHQWHHLDIHLAKEGNSIEI